MIGVLFVCLGNICRSPAAEGAFKRLVERDGLQDKFFIDSAGTIDRHQGELPDSRMRTRAKERGLNLSSRSRPLVDEDFDKFDYIIVMDKANHRDVCKRDAKGHYKEKVRLMMEFAPDSSLQEVPDPYFGGIEGFNQVLDMVESAGEGLLKSIKQQKALGI